MSIYVRAFACPPKYYQGPGLFSRLGELTKDLGESAFVIISPSLANKQTPILHEIFASEGRNIKIEIFRGQTTRQECERLTKLSEGFDMVIGIGGGKVLDSAKYAGIYNNAKIIMVPTVVSTDAPTSALSATYTESGEHAGSIYYKRNPDVIIVDSDIIMNSPERYFVSGMGDALSTYFEAKAHVETCTKNRVGEGYKTSLAAMNLSELCFHTLMRCGKQALSDFRNGLCSEAVEDVIEANTLLSGIGCESAGCATAHSLNSGFSALWQCHKSTHGEIVAFSTLCELVIENYSREMIDNVFDFCMSVGLPITLAEIGVYKSDHTSLVKVAEKARTTKHIAAVPADTSVDNLITGILKADEIGEEKRKSLNPTKKAVGN